MNLKRGHGFCLMPRNRLTCLAILSLYLGVAVSCDFDSGLCSGWSQSSFDSFDWTLQSGSTLSSSTGPSSGHGGSEYYMYIETSSPRVAGDKAILELTVPATGSASCLTFYYHMYGAEMGTLNVYNGNNIVFTKSGNQGNRWIQAKRTLDLQGNVAFEGEKGSSFRSDIAIDDVSITNGSCPVCMVSLNQSFGRIEVNSDELLCKWTIGSAGISQAVASVFIEHLLWSCSEFVRIYDGSGSEVFNQTGCSLLRNGTFQEISFGEENNITVHVSLIYGNSYVKIQYGILKEGLDSALLLSDWKVTVLNSTSSSLLIEWEQLTTQLNDGVRLYIALVRNINGSLLTSQIVPENTTTVQITGLESYTKYLVGVVGVDGVGQPYKSLELLTTTEEGVPSRAPQNVTLTNLDQTVGVLVQWISLSQSYANGRVLGYLVKYRESWSLSPYKSINTSRSQVILRNLKPGHRYEILVAAFTSKGEGPHSYGNITTNCGIFLNQSLGQVDVTHMDYSYVLCNWRIGNGGINQAVALASFQELRLSSCSEFVKIFDGNGSVVFYHDGCSSYAPETLRYIPFGEANSITVQSYFGWSGSSVKLKYAILKQGLHSALLVDGWNVTVTNTAGNSLTVQWTYLVAELDRPVRLYIAVVKSTDNIVLTVEIMRANTTMVALYGLNPSTQYKVGVIAVDDIGQAHKGAEVVSSTTEVPCGYRPSLTRIVGGAIAPVNSWPWQVMLMGNEGHFCGGSLVDPLWVVTAAHCFDGESTSSITIRLGAHYRTSGAAGTEQDIDVVRIVQHENYKDPFEDSNDIALIKLAKPAILGQGVGLVCLPNTSFALPLDNANKLCWITGWGTLSSGGVSPNVLMQASLPLVSRQRCLTAYPSELDDSMLCAGLDEGGVDACQGDSGGPLVCEFNGTWYLEGATSFGNGCAEAGMYGVYASVRHQKAWILGNMFGVAQPTTPTLSTAIPPSSALVWCNFESASCPGWSQSSFDDFDWTLGAGSTQSSLTGPSSGHGGSGWYFYIETSFPRMSGENAKLEVSVPGNGTASCLTFYYHMFGASIGTLNVFSGQAKIFSISGNQSNSWIQVQKTIYLDSVVLFEGIAGPSYTGDLAIDDVSIIIGSCQVAVCDFDSGLCSGWSQSSFDSFDWTLQSGSTSSSSTGPSSGHGGSGYYMYIEATSPYYGANAKLELTVPATGSASCLTFYYHMYGASMGTLNVYNGNNIVFTKSGDQGDRWIQAMKTLDLQGNVIFEGVRGSSYESDIAIDDVSITDGSCPVAVCDFDSGLCSGWSQSSFDIFDWTLQSGSTSSSSTGPSSGHGGSGYYMYIETSDQYDGDNATLEFTVPATGSASCLTFYYHMYGASMGTLNVYNGNELVFTKTGDQGNRWIQAKQTLDLQGNVKFEGIVGSSFTSDIAIDDVMITNGSCPVQTPPSTTSGPTTGSNPSAGPSSIPNTADTSTGSSSIPTTAYTTAGPSSQVTELPLLTTNIELPTVSSSKVPWTPSSEQVHQSVMLEVELDVSKWDKAMDDAFKTRIAKSASTYCAHVTQGCQSTTTSRSRARRSSDKTTFSKDEVHFLPGYPMQISQVPLQARLAFYLQFPTGAAIDAVDNDVLMSIVKSDLPGIEKSMDAKISKVQTLTGQSASTPSSKEEVVQGKDGEEESKVNYVVILGSVGGSVVVVCIIAAVLIWKYKKNVRCGHPSIGSEVETASRASGNAHKNDAMEQESHVDGGKVANPSFDNVVYMGVQENLGHRAVENIYDVVI